MTDLDSTRVLITGATSGLGRAMAEALAAAGAQVAVTGRDHARARAVASDIGGGATGFALDVRDAASVSSCVDAVERAFGGVDLLICNAGIGQQTVNPRFLTHPEPFWHAAPGGFRDVVDTKVLGTFLVARETVPRMLAAGGGRIVVISMNETTMTRGGFAPYGPAGAAVEALARVMAADLADTPVRLNILLPGGATATGMIPDGVPDELRAGLIDPAVMGPPIVWLASRAARDVHGERVVATEFVAPGGDAP
jgi:NAD(P)-dependent dehydrogenase (short-subunit alcohol dehydrogenase family)